MNYNRLITLFSCLAAALCGMASSPDTVKVIDHPDKVVQGHTGHGTKFLDTRAQKSKKMM